MSQLDIMRHLRLLALFSLVFVCCGCANQSYLKTDDRFMPKGWERIVVLPFTGKGQYVDLATSTFTLQMVGQRDFILVQPDETKVKLTQLGVSVGANTLTTVEAQKVASVFNAQGILMGNIDSYNNGATLNAFATVKLVDAASGQIVAAVHEPSGLLMAYSEQQCVIAAIENVANEVNSVLANLAKRNTALPTIPHVADTKSKGAI